MKCQLTKDTIPCTTEATHIIWNKRMHEISVCANCLADYEQIMHVDKRPILEENEVPNHI